MGAQAIWGGGAQAIGGRGSSDWMGGGKRLVWGLGGGVKGICGG